MKETAFKYFKDNNITTREELRQCVAEKPFNTELMEGFWKEYKKGGVEDNKFKVVVLNDLHVPYHNKQALNAVLSFIADFQPDKIILCGDIYDFYKLSRFDKDPSRMDSLQNEIDEGYHILKSMQELASSAEIHFIQGNHEARLQKYLMRNPELHGLRVLELPVLLRLDELGVIYHDHEYILNDFCFTHGSLLSSFSSGTPRKEHQKHGCSGISGHSHRLGSFYQTNYKGQTGWFENACLCDLRPEYVSGIPDWQNGFAVIYFDDNAFDVHQVCISHKNRFRFNGKLYS